MLEFPLHSTASTPEGASLGDVVPPAAACLSPAAERVIHVLLVSDRLLMRVGIRHLLEHTGRMRVAEVSSGEEARALAAADRPDIVVVDLDEYSDAAVRLADIAIGLDARVIALSDRVSAAEHSRLVECGALGVVLKTDPPEVLVKAIDKVCAGEAWLKRSDTARILIQISRRQSGEGVEAAKLDTLTRREREITALVAEGLKNTAIAERLFICEATVRNHLTAVLEKLSLSDRLELVVYAFRNHVVKHLPDGSPS